MSLPQSEQRPVSEPLAATSPRIALKRNTIRSQCSPPSNTYDFQISNFYRRLSSVDRTGLWSLPQYCIFQKLKLSYRPCDFYWLSSLLILTLRACMRGGRRRYYMHDHFRLPTSDFRLPTSDLFKNRFPENLSLKVNPADCGLLIEDMKLQSFPLISALSCLRSFASGAAHAVERWRLPPPKTSPMVIAEWETKDNALHHFLAKSIPEALAHTGAASFDHHLKGVQAILRNWGATEVIATAGLFHSIYGTEGFQGFKLPFTRRKEMSELIGQRSEKLVWIFCVVDRLSVDELVEKHLKLVSDDLRVVKTPGIQFQCISRVELGRFPINFKDESEWLDFVELTLADWLEQVEGAAEKQNDLYGWAVGEAWSYRRVAYHQMADLLVATRGQRMERAKQMVEEVYGMEPQRTRSLHQRVTPPMNDAAKEAREAWASALITFDEENTETCKEEIVVAPSGLSSLQ